MISRVMEEIILDLIRYGENRMAIQLRRLLYRRLFARCGGNLVIMSNVVIRNPTQINAGHNLGLQSNVFIQAGGGLIIGDDVMFANGVSVHTNIHGRDIPFKAQKIEFEAITIGNNVWIGAKATILAGVRIGDNVIIGAGAVVNRDVRSDVVVVGVPAREV